MRVQPAALPGTGVAGDIAIDSGASNALKYYNGTAWVSLTGGAGSPAGSTTQIQFNNAGAFGADANLSWDNTNKWLGIGGAPTMPIDVILPNGQYMAARLKGSATTTDVVMQIESGDGNGMPTLVLKQPGYTGFQFFARDSGGHNLYLNPGNDFNSPSANSLVFTNTSGNLGLAVGDTPARRLHLDGAMRINPTATPATPAAGDIFLDSGASNALKYYNGSAWVSLTGGGGMAGSGTTGKLPKFTAASTLGDSVLTEASGYIGVGVTPTVPLEVQTNATGFGLRVNRSSGASVDIQGGTTAGWIGTITNHPLNIFTNNGSPSMSILANSNVGIGTTTPRALLDVSGAIISKAAPANGTATIDFGTGNLQYTTSSCGAATFLLHNMKDGGSYSFAVQGGTSGVCAFNAYSDAGTTLLTMHLPQDHGFTQTGKHTIYTFMVMGTHAYAQWIPGY